MTQKAKDRKYLSRRKRYDMDPPALGELHAQPLPRPPPSETQRRPAKKEMNTFGEKARSKARVNAEQAGWSTWMPKVVVEVPEPGALEAPPNQSQQAIRGTLTSSARAVLSHSRRFAAESLQEQSVHGGSTAHGSSVGKQAGGGVKKPALDPMAA